MLTSTTSATARAKRELCFSNVVSSCQKGRRNNEKECTTMKAKKKKGVQIERKQLNGCTINTETKIKRDILLVGRVVLV